MDTLGNNIIHYHYQLSLLMMRIYSAEQQVLTGSAPAR